MCPSPFLFLSLRFLSSPLLNFVLPFLLPPRLLLPPSPCVQLQIRAWFSEDGSKVICGGENHNVYVWSAAEYQSGLHLLQDPTGNGQTTGGDAKDDKKNVLSISSQKPDVKCDSSESFRAFNDTCTSAQFMPLNTVRLITDTDADAAKMRHLIVAAGYQGDLKFFANFGPRKAT